MPPSAELAATKSDREPRSASSPCETPSDSGIREISVRNCGIFTTARSTKANRCACSRFPTGRRRDVWQYIQEQNIPIVPLYYARQRKVVFRGTNWIPVDESRGCARRRNPCHRMGAVPHARMHALHRRSQISKPTTIEEIVAEARAATRSERETRVIDHGANTMEDKKREGYF